MPTGEGFAGRGLQAGLGDHVAVVAEHGLGEVRDAGMVDERLELRAMLKHLGPPDVLHAVGLGLRRECGEHALEAGAQGGDLGGREDVGEDEEAVAVELRQQLGSGNDNAHGGKAEGERGKAKGFINRGP